jgi:hypothetical protein
MTIEWAREDWAARVNKQARQMRIIAAAANDDIMRRELVGYAVRLEAQVAQIRGRTG